MTTVRRCTRRALAILVSAIAFGATMIAVQTPAIADSYTRSGCTMTNYYPNYASGKVIFLQKMVCNTVQNGISLTSINGWSNRAGYNDKGRSYPTISCFNTSSCTLRTTMNCPGAYYYFSAVNDYATNHVVGVNGIKFYGWKMTSWIGC